MTTHTGYVSLASSGSCADRTPTELEYIKLAYNDVIERIAEQKLHHWQIVRWVVTLNAVVLGFYFSNIGSGLSKTWSILPILIALVGILNYEAIKRDLNWHRRTLLSLREFMGGFIRDLHAPTTEPYLRGNWLDNARNNQIAVLILSSLTCFLLMLYK